MKFSSFLIALVLCVAAVGMLGRFSLEETLRASAGEAEAMQTVAFSVTETEAVDPFVFSEAVQFSLGETESVAGIDLTLSSVENEPFSAVFTNGDGTEITFFALEETAFLGSAVFKLSQVAPVDSSSPNLVRVILLGGLE